MKNKKIKLSARDIAILALSVIYSVGIETFFKPCAQKSDGSWMLCHWAGNSVFAFSLAILAISLAHFFISDSRAKIGLSAALIPVSLFSALIPGIFVRLCISNTMRCHTIMRPSVIIISVLLIIVAVIDIFLESHHYRLSKSV